MGTTKGTKAHEKSESLEDSGANSEGERTPTRNPLDFRAFSRFSWFLFSFLGLFASIRGFQGEEPRRARRSRPDGFQSAPGFAWHRRKGFLMTNGFAWYRGKGFLMTNGFVGYRGKGFFMANGFAWYRGKGFFMANGFAWYRGKGFLMANGFAWHRGKGFLMANGFAWYRRKGFSWPTGLRQAVCDTSVT